MPYPYNPQGALNGLFAPAYIPGNPQAAAAAAAYNAARQAQIRPAAPPPGTPGTPGTPFNPAVGGPGFRPGARFGGAPAPVVPPVGGGDNGGSFTFTEPTLPPVQQPRPLEGSAPVNRNSIAMALMNRRM
jgi:hypothetical protein